MVVITRIKNDEIISTKVFKDEAVAGIFCLVFTLVVSVILSVFILGDFFDFFHNYRGTISAITISIGAPILMYLHALVDGYHHYQIVPDGINVYHK